jgi:two-component system chemotaxis response regulator CheB
MRVLVVDDSMLYRKVIRDALAGEPGIEIVGTAASGRLALAKIAELRPEIVTLDLELPDGDGLTVLEALRERGPVPGVIMVSAAADTSADRLSRALRLGAFDLVLKPTAENLDENRERLRAELVPKIRLLAEQLKWERVAAGPARPNGVKPAPAVARATPLAPPRVIAIGVSTGGPPALAELLPKLPADVPVPIIVVQHMPPGFTRSLADDLDKASPLRVLEAGGGERMQAGEVYIAPGGRQTKVIRVGDEMAICVTDDPPEKSCRPSVDYLFRSLAKLYGANVLAVVMTGMGDDGVLGCRVLKRKGAQIVVQDEASCVVYGMPRQVVEAGLADVVCPLSQLHEVILDSVSASRHFGGEGGVLCS